MSIKKINIKNNKGLLAITIARITLDCIYFNFISTIFKYEGFTAKFEISYYITSWLLLLTIILLVPKIDFQNQPSSIIVNLITLLYFVPFTTMVAFSCFDFKYIIANMLYWIMIVIFYKVLKKVKILPDNSKQNKSDSFILYIGLFFLVVVLGISGIYTGFRLSLSLENIYDYRSEATSFNMPTLLVYLFSASKAINPIIIVYLFSKKNYLLSSLFVFVQLLSFSIDGSKTVLMITILAALCSYYYKNIYLKKIAILFALISLVGLFEKLVFGSYNIITYFIRRVMFSTNSITYSYFDFFTNNTPDYFRQGFLRFFGAESNYTSIDHLIGAIYYNNPDLGANSGLISDAIANLGLLGILIMPLLLAVLFRLFDECVKGLEPKIYIIACITISFYLISSFFTTVLLTHGILALLLVLYMLPKNIKNVT
ncbi:O-antigen polymerase [Neobacillus sp. PS2-9]|uniref:O-antigen polymerase n=1 Tax=Neobacillus sp. PS2-9 TaxID=3070676 RepID=UPI0027E0E377|nr:O-antigen polymerase [Neobacillus sp. PS2-9]WML58624.1 O-antigen polymerase [Neobacillus sp. PS2-9]